MYTYTYIHTNMFIYFILFSCMFFRPIQGSALSACEKVRVGGISWRLFLLSVV